MKRAVQQQMLDFMGGGKYNINVGDRIFGKEIEFDTSKLTFVCLGTLTDLRISKTKKEEPLGFGTKTEQNTESYNITPSDLQSIGLEKELVGRLNTYLHTEEYSKEDLLRILKESSISPLIGFEKTINSNGKKLVIEDGVYEAIVDAAYELDTGARSLQTIMNNIRTHYLKQILRSREDTIYLDAQAVLEITSKTMSRRSMR